MNIEVSPALLAKITELEAYERDEAPVTLNFTWAYYDGGTSAVADATGSFQPYARYDVTISNGQAFIYKEELDKWSYSETHEHPLSAEYEAEEEN